MGLVVGRIAEPMPESEPDRNLFIQHRLGIKPEDEQFVTLAGWRNTYETCGRELTKTAKRSGLDSEGLARVLRSILENDEGHHIYVPIRADTANWNGQFVWIVTLQWQNLNRLTDGGRPWKPGHVRAYAVTPNNLKVIAFSTCR
jgi:hypothetical protein